MRFFVGLTSLFFASAVFFSFADERAPSAPCEAELRLSQCKNYAKVMRMKKPRRLTLRQNQPPQPSITLS